jgi:hypothetical protein
MTPRTLKASGRQVCALRPRQGRLLGVVEANGLPAGASLNHSINQFPGRSLAWTWRCPRVECGACWAPTARARPPWSASWPPWSARSGWARVCGLDVTRQPSRVRRLGGPTTTHVWQALASIAALLAISAPAAVACYRHTTAT